VRAPVERRLAFDPPTERFSLPSLVSLGNGRYALYSYAGPPFEQLVATVDLAGGVVSHAPLGPGVGPVAAPSGQGPIGVVFVDQERDRPPYRAFFALHELGEGQLRPTPLGNGDVQHTFPGIAIGWSAERRQWGVVWSELGRIWLARFDERGRPASRSPILLAQQGALSHAARLVAAGGRWAIVTTVGSAYVVVESGDDGVVRETPIDTDDGAEPVIAWNGRRFGVLIREQWPPRRITFVAVANGEVLGRTALAEVTTGMIQTPVIHPDGDGFVAVFSAGPGGFDDRLMVARIDADGRPAAGYPRRLDPQEEVHQGYAAIAGEGCELAVSYTLGDPNGNVRAAIVQGP
jgi:hypothetical protein